jgi:putative MFS transporter
MDERAAEGASAGLQWAGFRQALTPTVLVATLGYFVDIYDLLLFRVVREPSLLALGVPDSQTLSVGLTLDNFQQAGLLIGGILWGSLGDKRGRVSVLYGSILLYSTANVLNAFISTIPQYEALRFLAGVGLAGELGVAITLVSEVLPPAIRGYGTTIIAAVGVLGAVVAASVAKLSSWKVAYLVGGSLGFGLLLLRVRLAESGLFAHAADGKSASRGNFLMLFASRERFGRYVGSIFMAIPIWFVIGLLVAYGNKLAAALGVIGAVTPADCILFAYSGLAVGDLSSGLVSQALASRRKAIGGYVVLTMVGTVIYFTSMRGQSASAFLGVCFLLGIGTGYWAMFMQSTAEQFGTNMRATATTSASNFVRAAVIPMGMIVKAYAPSYGLPQVVMAIGAVVFTGSFVALALLPETFGKSLDFVEE